MKQVNALILPCMYTDNVARINAIKSMTAIKESSVKAAILGLIYFSSMGNWLESRNKCDEDISQQRDEITEAYTKQYKDRFSKQVNYEHKCNIRYETYRSAMIKLGNPLPPVGDSTPGDNPVPD